MGRSDSAGKSVRSDIGADGVRLFKAQTGDSTCSPDSADALMEEYLPELSDPRPVENGTTIATSKEKGIHDPHHRLQ